VGLTYTRKHAFRGKAIAAFGEPVDVAFLRADYERDEREAVRRLTALIQERLEELTLNFEHPEDAELVDVAERLYAREKKLAGWRERDPMAERLPRLRRFAEGVRWLRQADPERLHTLRAQVRRYLRLLTLFGAREADVPRRYSMTSVLAYSARQIFMLLLVLPLALAGMAAWFVPFMLTSWVAPRFRPPLDQVASYKLGAAVLAFPLWYAGLLFAAWRIAGIQVAGVAAVVLPLVGLAAVAWRDRQEDVSEDLRVFLRARRLSRGRDRLAEQRAGLAAEFDRLAEAWRAGPSRE
jgi:hypothetical protein